MRITINQQVQHSVRHKKSSGSDEEQCNALIGFAAHIMDGIKCDKEMKAIFSPHFFPFPNFFLSFLTFFFNLDCVKVRINLSSELKYSIIYVYFLLLLLTPCGFLPATRDDSFCCCCCCSGRIFRPEKVPFCY